MWGEADKPLVVVQARTGSRRLPAKVLADLCGRPVLSWLLERLAASRTTGGTVVATTTISGDDAIAQLCAAHGVRVVRGHPTDVLARFNEVLDQTGAVAVVRVSADSPFIDAEAVDLVVRDFKRGGAELVQNHRTPGWPVGTAVEVLTSECLRRLDQAASDPRVREHVTLYAYENPDEFRIRHVPAPPALRAPQLRLHVDTVDDLEWVRTICSAFGPRRDFGLIDIVARFAGAGAA